MTEKPIRDYEALKAAREMAAKDTAIALERVAESRRRRDLPKCLEIPPDVIKLVSDALDEAYRYFKALNHPLTETMDAAIIELVEAIEDSEATEP